MVNRSFTDCQQPVLRLRHNLFMDQVWERIDKELARRRKTWQWLYTELGYSKERVNNWSRRGIPATQYVAISHALGKSVDWLISDADEAPEDIDAGIKSHNAEAPQSHFALSGVSVKMPVRAPVIAWARLGVDLDTRNDQVPAEAHISVPEDASNKCKWVTLDSDYPSFRLKRNSKVALDPELSGHKPEDGGLYLFLSASGRYILAEYRGLANDSFEALPHDGPPMDRDRHGLEIIAIVRGTWR